MLSWTRTDLSPFRSTWSADSPALGEAGFYVIRSFADGFVLDGCAHVFPSLTLAQDAAAALERKASPMLGDHPEA
jgi:hypothetical protein